ncbi:dsDNA nuclease domain-containing protein [Mucilaginibacter sp.]
MSDSSIVQLKSLVFEKPPREIDGAKTSNRYDFQKNWAICKLIELHTSTDDYLLCFEFHDDIVVFDSSSDPKTFKCFQIKTKDAVAWTLASLVAAKKGENGPLPSTLAKMYKHVADFGEHVESVYFVTNAKIKATLINDADVLTLDNFTLKDLSAADNKKVCEKLTVELSNADLSRFREITHFLMGELDLKHHADITKSRLATYIEQKLPDVKYQIGPLYKTIFDEVKNKTNLEINITGFEQLKKLKAISRSDFGGYLNVLSDQETMKEKAAAIEQRLNTEGVSFKFVIAFKAQAKIYEIAKMNYGDKNLQQVTTDITELISNYSVSLPESLHEQLNLFYGIAQQRAYANNLMSEIYIKTIILFELYGKE